MAAKRTGPGLFAVACQPASQIRDASQVPGTLCLCPYLLAWHPTLGFSGPRPWSDWLLLAAAPATTSTAHINRSRRVCGRMGPLVFGSRRWGLKEIEGNEGHSIPAAGWQASLVPSSTNKDDQAAAAQHSSRNKEEECKPGRHRKESKPPKQKNPI